MSFSTFTGAAVVGRRLRRERNPTGDADGKQGPQGHQERQRLGSRH